MMKRLYLASPRGFCAGVRRAISIVENSIEANKNKDVYVYHEIVHNKFIIEKLKAEGVKFIDDLNLAPTNSELILSAHGASKYIEKKAEEKNISILDATCPLVKKIHRELVRLIDEGYEVLLIGHREHPEIVGTVGQVDSHIHIISERATYDELPDIVDKDKIAFLTQTTLSQDDIEGIIGLLNKKYPNIEGYSDICYATQNRQNAVKELCRYAEVILVIGSPNSSNSNRLREVAELNGVKAYLIDSFEDIDYELFDKVERIGITAGASAPECLVTELIEKLKSLGYGDLEEIVICEENIEFKV
jgi:4-hydroxy-3-methylbut-2-enyl diphosphate reductase